MERVIFEREDYTVQSTGPQKTGQTTAYRTGDDGDLEKGWNDGTRFYDMGDETVADVATGLMWPQDWSGDGGNSGNVSTWNDAIDWAAGLIFVGHSDWRLPNLIELMTVINLGTSSPRTYDAFSNVFAGLYWTASTSPVFVNYAYVVNFLLPALTGNTKTESKHIVAVRNA